MPSAVKLSDEIVAVARKEALVMKRSIAGQVEFWAQLGRSVEAAGLILLTHDCQQSLACTRGSGWPGRPGSL